MNTAVLAGLMVPFFGTTLGSMMVFFMRKQLNERLNKMLTGFAAGVMESVDSGCGAGKRINGKNSRVSRHHRVLPGDGVFAFD